jgi:hypothetical protein
MILYRHVLIGFADAASIADFWLWAAEAGRCVAVRPTSQIGGAGGEFTWLNYVAVTARQFVPKSPLRAKCYSRLSSLFGEFDGPHYVRLRSPLFQASVYTIDLIQGLFEDPDDAAEEAGRAREGVDPAARAGGAPPPRPGTPAAVPGDARASGSNPIPPEHRTKVMTVGQAAAYRFGDKGKPKTKQKRLSRWIRDGAFSAYRVNRQTYVFDAREFPAHVQEKIKPIEPPA